ncbi:MAG: hypothetical protein ABFS41_14770 [Myxococcota bacterium]
MWTLVAFAGCAAVLVWHAFDYVPFFADDSFISLRYAARLIEGHGLTWTDGERVEGYSNFLWVIAIAAAGLAGNDLVVTARVLGVACTVAMLGAYFWVHRGRGLRVGVGATSLASLLVALSGSVAAHAIGGLEQPLLSALVVWGLVLSIRLLDEDSPNVGKIALPGILFGLAAVTRPDAPLIIAAICLAFVFARGVTRESVRVAVWLACISGAFYLGQLAFRLDYYGEWVPNTAHGKISWNVDRFASGWRYVSEAALPVAGLLSVAFGAGVLGSFRDRRLRGQLLVVAAPIALWCAYIVMIGGDHVPQRRHLSVAIGMTGLAAALAVGWLLDAFPGRVRGMTVVAGALIVATALAAVHSRDRQRAKRNQWFWTGKEVGRFLAEAFEDERPLVAVDAAGALPFYSRLPSLDMLGLTDRHIAKNPPKTLGEGMLAHELGDGRYVLDREPDLVVFNTPIGGARPNWRSGRQMLRDPRFRRDYRLVTFAMGEGGKLTSQMYVRLDGVVGIRREPGRVRVPGYLLSSGTRSRTSLDDAHAVRLRVIDEQPAQLRGLRLDAGTWRIEMDARGSASVRVRNARGEVLASTPAEAFTLDGRVAVAIAISAGPSEPVALAWLDLVRQGTGGPPEK